MRIVFCRIAMVAAMLLAWSSPAAAQDSALEEANKQLVLDFYDALNDADEAGAMADRIASIAETYLHPAYTQRAGMFRGLPGEGSDRDKLVGLFRSLPPMPGPPAPRPDTVSIMAEDDLVMLLTRRERTDPATGQTSETFIFNMFRVEDGKLIEHWDTSPAGGPPPGPPPGAPAGPPPGAPVAHQGSH